MFYKGNKKDMIIFSVFLGNHFVVVKIWWRLQPFQISL
jgi:hypothetical protein